LIIYNLAVLFFLPTYIFSQDGKKQNEVFIAIASLLRSPGGIEAGPNLSAIGYNPSENVVYSLFGMNKIIDGIYQIIMIMKI
jgi:hypothetical protein